MTSPAAPGPRRRKPPRPVEVVSVSRLAPRLVAVQVGGDAPDGFAIEAPTEAAAMRRIRQHFLRDQGRPASSLVTRGYWRLGAANHPDHDYGDDELDRR